MNKWKYGNIRFKGILGNELYTGREKAIEYMNELDNPLDAMQLLEREIDHVQFLWDNQAVFKEQGVFETAVVDIYTGLRTPCRSYGIDTWWELFNECHFDFLKVAANEPFSPINPDRFFIYRGCTEDGVQGLSWTLSKETAKFFANTWIVNQSKDKDAKVFTAVASIEDVAFFANDRKEFEVVLHPGSVLFMELDSECWLGEDAE